MGDAVEDLLLSRSYLAHQMPLDVVIAILHLSVLAYLLPGKKIMMNLGIGRGIVALMPIAFMRSSSRVH